MPGGETLALDDHVVLGLAHDLGRDVADDLTDLLDLLLVVVTGLRDEGRVRGDAVDDAPVHAGLDLFVHGGVEEELHLDNSCRWGAVVPARPCSRAYASAASVNAANSGCGRLDRKSTRLNSSHSQISY